MKKAHIIIAILLFNQHIICIGQLEINLDKALQNKGELLLNEIASDIEFIKLETTKNCYFYHPSDIQIINERIYFYDQKLARFFIFGWDGKFIKHFGQQGKGPGEYVSVQKFSFDNKKNELVVFTRERKILKYNLDGELIGSVPINANPLSILPLNGSYLGFYPSPTCLENKNFTLSQFNSKGKLLKSFFSSIPCEGRDAIMFSRFYSFRDEIRFWECSIDTIYKIDSKFDVLPLYTLSSKKMIPYEMYSSLDLYQSGVQQYISVQKIMESERYLFIKGRAESFGTGMFIVLDKNNSKSIVLQDDDFKKIGVKDNMISPLYFWPDEVLTDGRMVCSFEIMDLKAIFSNVHSKTQFLLQSKYQLLKKVVENSKVDDNPILFVIKLKNDQ